MSVNLIENFQLGTNLPLDNRYVVNSKNDVSLYWFPGMQIFQRSTKTFEWYDGSIWHNVTDSSSVSGDYVSIYGDTIFGPLVFNADSVHEGGEIYSPSEGILGLKSDLALGFTAPYLIIPDASDKVGSYLSIGENGIIKYISNEQSYTKWEDILTSDINISDTNEQTILTVTPDQDVSYGSVTYEVTANLPWWRTVIFRSYIDNSLYNTETYTGNTQALFADSIPVNASGIPANSEIKLTIESDVSNYTILTDSFLEVEKFGNSFSSPLTTKGDIFVYSDKDDRLPIGNDNQILIANSSTNTGLEWVDLSTGYGYFTYWAEENSIPNPNAFEWSWGNGDEAASGSGVMVPINCELYAIGTTASNNSRFTVEIYKSGVATGAVSDTMTSKTKLTILNNPVEFSAGNTVDFKTISVDASDYSGIRAAAYFRYKISGLKGEKGDKGDPGEVSLEYVDGSLNRINNYQIIQDNSISKIESSLGDYVRKDGDIMTGNLQLPNIIVTNDASINNDLTTGGQAQFGNTNSFPSSPKNGALFYRADLNKLFTYDPSGGWLTIDRYTYQAGKGRARSANTVYLEVGSAAQSSDVGFRMPNNGTILNASIQNRNQLTSSRTMSIRINDSSVSELVIPINEYGSEVNNIYQNFDKGDLIQLVIEAGGSRLNDIIATINVAWR